MSEHAEKSSRPAASHEPTTALAQSPGKQTRTEQAYAAVQRNAASAQGTGQSEHVHGAAAQGVATPSQPLPHRDRIQQLFGRHDVSQVQAHVGSDAAASADAMGAKAYATGDHVVLGQATDLGTVAHEAAHVVQQRGGVHLKGGVGQVGDAYERQADEVADRVVRGESAEALLDTAAGGGAAAGGAVQRKTTIADDPADPTNKTAPGTGAGLLNDSSGKTLLRRDVAFGPLVNDCGSSVEAWRYPGDDIAGSKPSALPSWWGTMLADPAVDRSWVSSNLVQGHLLNEHLGGPGSDMRNLTPFAKSTNSQHHAYVEKKAKAILAQGNIVRYHVVVDYGTPVPAAWFGNKIPAVHLANFAYSIKCILGAHHPTTGNPIGGMEDVTTITNAVKGQG